MKGLATPEEVAEYLHVKPGTLRVWVHRKVGPPYIQVEGQRLYRWEDIEQYLNDRTVRHG